MNERLNPESGPPFNRPVQLRHAPRLSEAEHLLEEQAFDLIICDLTLPDSYGIETLQQVKGRCNDTPIIVLTGYDDNGTGENALKLGANRYLVKSEINQQILQETIQSVLREQRS